MVRHSNYESDLFNNDMIRQRYWSRPLEWNNMMTKLIQQLCWSLIAELLMHEMPLFANAWNAIVDTDNDAFRMNQTHLQLYIGRVIINWDLLFNPSSRNRAWGLSSLTVGYFMGAFIATYIHLVPANTCCVSCSLSPGGNTFIKPSLQWKPSCRCHHAPTHMKEVAINRIHREAFLLGKKPLKTERYFLFNYCLDCFF